VTDIVGEKERNEILAFLLFKMPALCIGKALLGIMPSTYITNCLQVLYTSIE
jgi:hypothetical protein